MFFFLPQGLRMDPNLSLTLRLEFAHTNSRTSPKQASCSCSAHPSNRNSHQCMTDCLFVCLSVCLYVCEGFQIDGGGKGSNTGCFCLQDFKRFQGFKNFTSC